MEPFRCSFNHTCVIILFLRSIVAPALTFNVVNSGASDYIIDGVAAKSLAVSRGQTYAFNVSASGHPFWINSVQGTGQTNAYTTGVYVNGVQTGILYFVVPANAPDRLYYNCEYHGAMTGTIAVFDRKSFHATFFLGGVLGVARLR